MDNTIIAQFVPLRKSIGTTTYTLFIVNDPKAGNSREWLLQKETATTISYYEGSGLAALETAWTNRATVTYSPFFATKAIFTSGINALADVPPYLLVDTDTATAGTTYEGFVLNFGSAENYLIRKTVTTATTVSVSFNVGESGYATAWSDRTTISYVKNQRLQGSLAFI